MTVTFDEAVYGFTADDLSATNANTGNLQGSDGGTEFSVTVTPTANSNILLGVAADAAADAAGNGNARASTLSVQYSAVDSTAPTMSSVARSNPTAEVTNANTLVWRVTFSEEVTVAAGAFGTNPAVTGTTVAASAVTASPDTAWNVQVSGGADIARRTGTIGLTLADASKITDGAGNALTGGLAAGAETYTHDNIGPSTTLGGPASHDGSTAFTVTVTFTEGVYGFTASELGATNANTGNLQGSDGDTEFRVTVTPTANSEILLSVFADAAADAAGNGNSRASVQRVAYSTVDSTAPTVASIERQTPSGENTNADTLTFRVTFSEDVENVGAADFAVVEPGGGTATTATVTGVQGAQRRRLRRRHRARQRVPRHRGQRQPGELRGHGGARFRRQPGHRGRGRQRPHRHLAHRRELRDLHPRQQRADAGAERIARDPRRQLDLDLGGDRELRRGGDGLRHGRHHGDRRHEEQLHRPLRRPPATR